MNEQENSQEVIEEIKIDFTKSPGEISRDILALPFKDQDYQIALWIAQSNILDDMRYRPLPSRPTKMTKEVDAKISQDQRSSIEALNWRNLKNLKWAKGILRDEELKNKIDLVISRFIDTEEYVEPVIKEDNTHKYTD